MKNSAWWQMSRAMATVTLTDRARRRGFINGLLAFIMAWFAVGQWVLDEWLGAGLWRMLFYWGFLVFLCLMMVLLALFDALSVVGEERQKLGLGKRPDEEGSTDD
jgi:hypothetical protein